MDMEEFFRQENIGRIQDLIKAPLYWETEEASESDAILIIEELVRHTWVVYPGDFQQVYHNLIALLDNLPVFPKADEVWSSLGNGIRKTGTTVDNIRYWEPMPKRDTLRYLANISLETAYQNSLDYLMLKHEKEEYLAQKPSNYKYLDVLEYAKELINDGASLGDVQVLVSNEFDVSDTEFQTILADTAYFIKMPE